MIASREGKGRKGGEGGGEWAEADLTVVGLGCHCSSRAVVLLLYKVVAWDQRRDFRSSVRPRPSLCVIVDMKSIQ